jgi:outer membrane protein assembly factor BamB
VGDTLYIGSCSGNFYALDKNTGQVRWSYNIHQDGSQTSFHGDPLMTGDLIIIGTDIGKQGHVYAFDRATGKVRWKYLVTTSSNGDFGVASDIVRRGNSIYAVAQGDDLLCLDLATGKLRWQFASGFDRTRGEWANSPALAGNLVIFDGYDGFVYALDADSGKPIWKTNLGSPVTTSPIIAGGNIYAATSGHFYRLRATDGGKLDSITVQGEPWRNITLASGDLLALCDLGPQKPEDTLCLNLAAQKVEWTAVPPGGGGGVAWPYVWHSEVLSSDIGHLYAYRQTDGSLAWSHAFPGQLVRGIGVTPDMLYVGTMQGMIYAFTPPQR